MRSSVKTQGRKDMAARKTATPVHAGAAAAGQGPLGALKRSQQGLVMMMTLILLVVMALGTAVAVRLSLTTDMVGANLRARTLAFQAAEAALRFCERQVINNFAGTPMITALSWDEWTDENQWNGPAGRRLTPQEINVPAQIKTMPQCLFRYLTIDDWRQIAPPKPGTVTAESRGFDSDRFRLVRITVRGYSPDYVPANSGDPQTAKGSEVRLQSMVRVIQ